MLAAMLIVASAAARQSARSSSKAGSSSTVPRTAWGDPDFDGIWNHATMTPLERPREFGDKDVLTPQEAAAYEQLTIER